MSIAVTLRMQAQDAGPVVALMQRLADAGIARDQLDLGYGPHLTLAVWDEARIGIDPDALGRIAADRDAPACVLSAVAFFPGVIWLAPAACARLLALHDAVTAAWPDPVAHYRRGAWTPHVTLSAGIADPAAALTALGPLPLPLPARFDRLECVRFPPVQVLRSVPLRG